MDVLEAMLPLLKREVDEIVQHKHGASKPTRTRWSANPIDEVALHRVLKA
jgi:hypothetical protein